MKALRLPLAGLVLVHALGSFASAQDCTGVSPAPCDELTSETRVTGLTQPLIVLSPPGDVERLFIVEQPGTIRFHREGDASGTTTLFLDLTDRVNNGGNEQGLLGMAFDPDYDTTGEFYVNYTSDGGDTVVSRFSVSADPDAGDAGSEVQLLRYSQPQTNHNGGHLEFGPDGYLYISSGDGGGGGDQHGACGNGQNLGNLLGKILRIDVRGIAPSSTPPDCDELGAGNYQVPADGPFADGPGGSCDEIWAYGLRNPWRFAFDSDNGDVGQQCWEEINYLATDVDPGANFGWRQMEGNNCFDPNNQLNCDPAPVACPGSPPCDDPSLTDPVLVIGHGADCSVTGGYVYRGCRLTSLTGRYFHGDFCSGRIRSFVISGGVATDEQDHTAEIDPFGTLQGDLTSFGVDARGELYICDRDGAVLKIVDNCDPCPDPDRDRICSQDDNCPDDRNKNQRDRDGDGLGDACDPCPEGFEDNDEDGTPDACDNCPDDANPGQEDSDGDKIGDVCDNCPNKRNKNQADSDGDGLGNACDPCRRDPTNNC